MTVFDYVEFALIFCALYWFVSTHIASDLPDDFLPKLSEWIEQQRKLLRERRNREKAGE